MLTNVPLMVVPLVLYNLVITGLLGTSGIQAWSIEAMRVEMLSGAVFVMTLGELMIALGLVLLFFEIINSNRSGKVCVVDHLLSIFVFLVFLVEFLIVKAAVHPVFFILMLISLVNVLSGLAISARAASRDVSIGG